MRERKKGGGEAKKNKGEEVERINAHIHATQASARKITVVICGNSGSRLFLRASRRVVRRRVDLTNDRANSLHSIIINGISVQSIDIGISEYGTVSRVFPEKKEKKS